MSLNGHLPDSLTDRDDDERQDLEPLPGSDAGETTLRMTPNHRERASTSSVLQRMK